MRRNRIKLLRMLFIISLLCAGCSAENAEMTKDNSAGASVEVTVEEPESLVKIAAGGETASQMDVVEDGMEPIYGDDIKDGVYSIQVNSSSNMFQITHCELTVKDGIMTGVMTMGGKGYLKLYMGTSQEAVEASEQEYISFAEQEDGTHSFKVTVNALDMGIDCSAYSKKKEKWYDRTLVFRADSLPADAWKEGKITTVESLNLEDGTYTVKAALEGGSGRASIESPVKIKVEDGKIFATVIWGSANYDYMKVENEKYDQINTEGNSAFEIPVAGFDWKIPVVANTIAMSEPHEINYTLFFDSSTLKKAES